MGTLLIVFAGPRAYILLAGYSLNQLESEPTREEMSEKLVQTDEKSAEATQARSNLVHRTNLCIIQEL